MAEIIPQYTKVNGVLYKDGQVVINPSELGQYYYSTPGTATPVPSAPSTPAPTPAAPAASSLAPATGPLPNTPPSGLFGVNPPATGNTQFATFLQSAVDRLGTANDLMKTKNLLVKALYDNPLSADELAQIPENIRGQVQGFDPKNPDPAMRSNLEMQLRLTNDSIAGRTGTMNQSIQFLTGEYDKSVQNLEQQKQDAIQMIQNAVSVYGSAAFSRLTPEDRRKLEERAGLPNGYLDKLPATISETRYKAQYGSGGSGYVINIPQNAGSQMNQLAFRNNNPGNLKFANQQGATLGAGGFAKFDTPEDGYQALLNQIQLNQSQNMTVAQFLSRYAPPSENDTEGYIKQFTDALGVPRTANIGDISTEDIADFIMKKESGTTRDITESDAQVQADAIMAGTQPPPNPTVGRSSIATQKIFAELARRGFDVGKAYLQYQAALKTTQSLNGPQMIRFRGLATSVVNTIDEVKTLADQMKLSGVPLLNKTQLAAYIQVAGNSEKGQLAARYLAAVNTLKEEFANLAQGGYAPTEAAWSLANKQINENYGVKELNASLVEVQRLINYRVNAIEGITPLTIGGGSSSDDPLGILQ